MSEFPVLVSVPAPGSDASIGEGEGEAGGVIDYCDDWLMDELSQDNPYFDCQQCHLWHPANTQWKPYNVCTYCHFNVADDNPSCLQCCMARNHAALEASSFTSTNGDKNTAVCQACRGG
jgi:hypothetical protein